MNILCFKYTNFLKKYLPNLILKFLSFSKSFRENQGHFHNHHEQGYWKMFFSNTFQEDEIFKNKLDNQFFRYLLFFQDKIFK